MSGPEPLTARTYDLAPGRLFAPLVWDTGWSLSLQADHAGYACAPRARLAHLEAYREVEAMIAGPFPEPVDPATLGLPANLAAKFTPPEPGCPALGKNITWEEVEAIKQAIVQASLFPNAGIPRGRIGWPGRRLWHGTTQDAAKDILSYGISLGASTGGTFGHAFYAADTPDLARKVYAAAAEEPGAVLMMSIRDDARVLDLRNSEDAALWTASRLASRLGAPDLPRWARAAGIDAVHDRAIGGLAIYNPDILEGICLDPTFSPPSPAPEAPSMELDF